MKNYTIKVVDKLLNALIEDKTELYNNKSFLQKKYEAKYRFIYPGSKIIVERLIGKQGLQMNIFDIIKE